MRKNLSEELKINDDVVLNDGSEAKEEEDKKAKEVEKEVQKELDSKNKIADEISDAKAPKVTANNGLGKSTKIKQFVEKLVLEEPSDTLNEDFEDELFDARDEAVHSVYDVLAKYARKALNIGGGVRDSIDSKVLDDCQSICDEAVYHLSDDEF